jgi:hypothetical protein
MGPEERRRKKTELSRWYSIRRSSDDATRESTVLIISTTHNQNDDAKSTLWKARDFPINPPIVYVYETTTSAATASDEELSSISFAGMNSTQPNNHIQVHAHKYASFVQFS